jgi:hypothetical protein
MKGVSLRLFGYHTNLDPSTGEEIITWRERRQVKVTGFPKMLPSQANDLIVHYCFHDDECNLPRHRQTKRAIPL